MGRSSGRSWAASVGDRSQGVFQSPLSPARVIRSVEAGATRAAQRVLGLETVERLLISSTTLDIVQDVLLLYAASVAAGGRRPAVDFWLLARIESMSILRTSK